MTELTQKLNAKIPWESGSEKGYISVDVIITGPDLCVKDISKELRKIIKYNYGSELRLSGGTD